jgi:hypothetical protein
MGSSYTYNCREQAIAQSCAFCSPFYGFTSEMAIFRQQSTWSDGKCWAFIDVPISQK